jgi:hypothetical protein
LARILRTVDPRSLDVEYDDDSFELVGMDDEIERLKEDFPQFFADEDDEPPARRRAAGNGRATAAGTRTAGRPRGAREVDGGNRGRQPAAPRGWKEQIAAQMMEGRR